MSEALFCGFAVEHSRDFSLSLLGVELVNSGVSSAFLFLLLDQVVVIGEAGDLGQVRDANDLALVCDLSNFVADGDSSRASDASVDLVKDTGWDRLSLCYDLLEGEHDSAQLSAAGDAVQRLGFFSGVA